MYLGFIIYLGRNGASFIGSTTVDPREKLEVLQKTYEEIESTVSRVVGKDYKLPMDDLLPLFMYVVSRAR